MRPQWQRRGSRIEYRIALPRAVSPAADGDASVTVGRRQTLGKHCESLPAEVRVRPDAENPVVREAGDLALATSHLAQSSGRHDAMNPAGRVRCNMRN